MPSAAARHAIAICGVYLMSVVPLLVSGNGVVKAFDAASDRKVATERERVTVEVVSGPCSVEELIADSGPGIPESIAPRLFELHVTNRDSGSGIGLFVARSAVDAAGGWLRPVRTGPGGTVFSIRLPAAKGEWVGQKT